MTKMATAPMRELFISMEKNGLLNVAQWADLYALHFVYLPRVNQRLKDFVQFWNSHNLSSEHNKSPAVLYFEGAIKLGTPNGAFTKSLGLELPREEVPAAWYRIEETIRDVMEGDDAAEDLLVEPNSKFWDFPRGPKELKRVFRNEFMIRLNTFMLDRVDPFFEDRLDGITVYQQVRSTARACWTKEENEADRTHFLQPGEKDDESSDEEEVAPSDDEEYIGDLSEDDE